MNINTPFRAKEVRVKLTINSSKVEESLVSNHEARGLIHMQFTQIHLPIILHFHSVSNIFGS